MKNFFILIPIFLIFFVSCKQNKTYDTFKSMNTYICVQVNSLSKNQGQKACEQVRDEILKLENILSTTIKESDIYNFNNSESLDIKVHAEIEPVFNFSKTMYQKTDGLFNPAMYPIIHEWGFTTDKYKIPSDKTISSLLEQIDFSKIVLTPCDDKNLPFKLHQYKKMQLDFGAIAKGYAGDCAINVLTKNGIKSALIDLGGNIQTLGRKNDGSLWTVGVKCPWNTEEVACSIKVESKAVVTSGGYERFFIGEDKKRYIHIFDPRTGYPAKGDLESVTIVCSKGMYADALSTSLFIMGKENSIDFWKQNKDFDFVLITKDKKLIYTEGLKNYIKVIFSFDKVTEVN